MAVAEKADVAAAFGKLTAFLHDGNAVVDGPALKDLTDALTTVDAFSRALKVCLDGAQCPAKVSVLEIPSGLMVDKDTPAPGTIEFRAEYQAP